MPAGSGLILNLTLVFSAAGIHFLHVMIDGKEVKSLPFTVIEAPPKTDVSAKGE